MPPQARYEQHDDVGELVLDAPPLNLFGPAMFDDLSAAIAQAQQAKPRALVLRSDADAFSAGADVRVFSELDAESAQPFTERLLAFAHAVEDLPCPTLASLEGCASPPAWSSRSPATCCGRARECSSVSSRRWWGSRR